MRRTRHVTLPVRSWQYIGLLVVSLACLTLGLVARDREGRAGSLAGPELEHKAPHDVDACPNLNFPFAKTPSCPANEQDRIKTVHNDVSGSFRASRLQIDRFSKARVSDLDNRVSRTGKSKVTEQIRKLKGDDRSSRQALRSRYDIKREDRSSRRLPDIAVRLSRASSDSQLLRSSERRSRFAENRDNSDRRGQIRQLRTDDREERRSASMDRRQDKRSRVGTFDYRRRNERRETIPSYRQEQRETAQRVDQRKNIDTNDRKYNRELRIHRSQSIEGRETVSSLRRESRDASQNRIRNREERIRLNDRLETRNRVARSVGPRESNELLTRGKRESGLRIQRDDIRRRQSRSVDRIRSNEPHIRVDSEDANRIPTARERRHRFAERRDSLERRTNERRNLLERQQRIAERRSESTALRNYELRSNNERHSNRLITRLDARRDIRYKNYASRDNRAIPDYSDNYDRNEVRKLSTTSADAEQRRERQMSRRTDSTQETRENREKPNRVQPATKRSNSDSEFNRRLARSESRRQNLERFRENTDRRIRTKLAIRRTSRMEPELGQNRRHDVSRDRLALVDSRRERVDFLRNNKPKQNRIESTRMRISRSDSELNRREDRRREVSNERRAITRSSERLSLADFQRESTGFSQQNVNERRQTEQAIRRSYRDNSDRRSERLEQRKLANSVQKERDSNRRNIRSNALSTERRTPEDFERRRLTKRFVSNNVQQQELDSREMHVSRNDLQERSRKLAYVKRNGQQTLADARRFVSSERATMEERTANRRSLQRETERSTLDFRREQTRNDDQSRRARINSKGSRSSDDSRLIRRFTDRTQVPALRTLKTLKRSRSLTEKRVPSELNDSRKPARIVPLIPETHRDIEFRTGIPSATAALKANSYYKYNMTYELIRQVFIIGLCTIYGLSIYHRKGTSVSNVISQARRFIVW